MLQPINIKVTDDMENYITAEMDAKIYSCLVSDGIIKGVGNNCQVIIGENDIKIQNGLLNIQGYFATINDFHSIPKPQQDNYYVKVKFTKGVSQDEFIIYTSDNNNVTYQNLFNGGTVAEIIIAEVKNKNQVTMKNVNDTFNNLRASLQNIFNTEQERRTAEEERKRAEQDRKTAEEERKRAEQNRVEMINSKIETIKKELNNYYAQLGRQLKGDVEFLNNNINIINGAGKDKFYAIKKIDNKLCIVIGTYSELQKLN